MGQSGRAAGCYRGHLGNFEERSKNEPGYAKDTFTNYARSWEGKIRHASQKVGSNWNRKPNGVAGRDRHCTIR